MVDSERHPSWRLALGIMHGVSESLSKNRPLSSSSIPGSGTREELKNLDDDQLSSLSSEVEDLGTAVKIYAPTVLCAASLDGSSDSSCVSLINNLQNSFGLPTPEDSSERHMTEL